MRIPEINRWKTLRDIEIRAGDTLVIPKSRAT
jgi:hypothetical protein